MGLSHSPRIVTSGLVLCLDAGNTKSYPGSGTTWSDLSGNGNNGTLSGPTFSATDRGCLTFTNGSKVTIPVSSLDLNDATLSVWIKFSSITGSQSFMALGDNDATIDPNTGTHNFNLGCYPDTPGWHTNTKFNGSWAAELNASSPARNTTSWVNLVGVYTVSGTSRSLYHNGSLIGSDALYNNPGACNSIRLGLGFGWQFLGNMSQASVYNRALSAAEVSQNYNALRGRYGI